MLRHILIATGILTLVAACASAQATRPPQPTPKPTAQPKPASPAPRREGQPINVKIELVITDQRGTGAPVKKNVSVIVGDEREGSIRSQSRSSLVGGGVQTVHELPAKLPEVRDHGLLAVDAQRSGTGGERDDSDCCPNQSSDCCRCRSGGNSGNKIRGAVAERCKGSIATTHARSRPMAPGSGMNSRKRLRKSG